jgi:hypothetical protein
MLFEKMLQFLMLILQIHLIICTKYFLKIILFSIVEKSNPLSNFHSNQAKLLICLENSVRGEFLKSFILFPNFLSSCLLTVLLLSIPQKLYALFVQSAYSKGWEIDTFFARNVGQNV